MGQRSFKVDNDDIVFSNSDGTDFWRLPSESILAIGEFTTPYGPADDYFLIFVAPGPLYYEASIYAVGRAEVIEFLKRRFDNSVDLKLAHSTDWNSRILWPVDLIDQQFFIFADRPKGFWNWLRALISPGQPAEVSPAILSLIARAESSGI